MYVGMSPCLFLEENNVYEGIAFQPGSSHIFNNRKQIFVQEYLLGSQLNC